MGKNRRGYTYSTNADRLLEYLYVFIGSGIVAIAFNMFLLPNRVASGGVSGISPILDAVAGWEPA